MHIFRNCDLFLVYGEQEIEQREEKNDRASPSFEKTTKTIRSTCGEGQLFE